VSPDASLLQYTDVMHMRLITAPYNIMHFLYSLFRFHLADPRRDEVKSGVGGVEKMHLMRKFIVYRNVSVDK
jgi:hypothetical protein